LKILAIDPGITTGWCKGEIVEHGELVLDPGQTIFTAKQFYTFLRQVSPARLICESFEFRKGTRQGLVLDSVKFIGICELYSQQFAIPLDAQKAAQGKGYYTNPKLKQAGLYIPALSHGMDALRHLLHWFTFGSGYQFNKSQSSRFARLV
jgi:hypothetical protein